MPTLEQLADRDRCRPLIEAKYPKGDLEELARECGISVEKLRQRARLLKVTRDKEVAVIGRLTALRRACQSTKGRRERFVRGPDNKKIYELMAMKKPLHDAGFWRLASLNERIIQSIKSGAAYDDFLTIHDGWGL